MRAAVVIKQLFWRLCTRGNGSLKCNKSLRQFCQRQLCTLWSIITAAALYFGGQSSLRQGKPTGYLMTPPTILIILIIPIIPIIPRLASPISTCVPQWSSSIFFGGSVLKGMALGRSSAAQKSIACGSLFFAASRPARWYRRFFEKNGDVNSATLCVA